MKEDFWLLSLIISLQNILLLAPCTLLVIASIEVGNEGGGGVGAWEAKIFKPLTVVFLRLTGMRLLLPDGTAGRKKSVGKSH